jgi:hypothetical protein
MRLELGRLRIRDVQFASSTRVAGGVLYVDRAAVEGIVFKDERIARASVEIARPGERVRIIPVKDVIEPRVKVRGAGGIFPGLVRRGPNGWRCRKEPIGTETAVSCPGGYI